MQFKTRTALAMIALAGCATTGPSEKAATEQQVRDTLLSFAQAMSDGDIDKASAFYADVADFYWIEKGVLRYKNAEEARTSLRGLGESGFNVNVTYTDIYVTMLGPKSALASAAFTSEFSNPSGESFSFDGIQTAGLILTRDGWRITSGHTETLSE